MAKKFPIAPLHPERICWGCDRYCAANAMACGNGSDRTQHPVELWGDDWAELERTLNPLLDDSAAAAATASPPLAAKPTSPHRS